jgi:hypothetical protein
MFPLCRSLKNSFSCSLKKVNNTSSSSSDDEYQTKSCDKLNKKKKAAIISSSSVADFSHNIELNTNINNNNNNNNKFVKFIRKKILNGFSKYLFYILYI